MSDDYDFSECDRLFGEEFGRASVSQFAGDHTERDLQLQAFRACYRLLRPENVDYAFKELEQRVRGTRATMLGTEDEQHFVDCHKSADAIRQQGYDIAAAQLIVSQQAETITEHREQIHALVNKVRYTEAKLSAAQQRLERWEGQQWQPIKTAPKDGTLILALVPGSDIPKVLEWCDEPEDNDPKDGEGIGWRMSWDSYYFGGADAPTHWMPLPPDLPDDEGEKL